MDQTISRHATTDQTPSDDTSKLELDRHSLRPDIQDQTRHPKSDQAASGQTSKLRSDSSPLRQHNQRRGIQAQTGQPQPQARHSGSDLTISDQTYHFKQNRVLVVDIQA